LAGYPRNGGAPGLPYIIVYRIESHAEEDGLAILGVYHGAQRRPGQG
jgi:hypothetical protein